MIYGHPSSSPQLQRLPPSHLLLPFFLLLAQDVLYRDFIIHLALLSGYYSALRKGGTTQVFISGMVFILPTLQNLVSARQFCNSSKTQTEMNVRTQLTVSN